MATVAALRKAGGAYTADKTDEQIVDLAAYFKDHTPKRRVGKGKAEGRKAFIAVARGKAAPSSTATTAKGGSFDLAAFLKTCPKGTTVSVMVDGQQVTVTA